MAFVPISSMFAKTLEQSLTEAIDLWMETTEAGSESQWGYEIGYVGQDTNRYMARAAIAVLLGLSEAQAYACRNKSLIEPKLG